MVMLDAWDIPAKSTATATAPRLTIPCHAFSDNGPYAYRFRTLRQHRKAALDAAQAAYNKDRERIDRYAMKLYLPWNAELKAFLRKQRQTLRRRVEGQALRAPRWRRGSIRAGYKTQAQRLTGLWLIMMGYTKSYYDEELKPDRYWTRRRRMASGASPMDTLDWNVVPEAAKLLRDMTGGFNEADELRLRRPEGPYLRELARAEVSGKPDEDIPQWDEADVQAIAELFRLADAGAAGSVIHLSVEDSARLAAMETVSAGYRRWAHYYTRLIEEMGVRDELEAAYCEPETPSTNPIPNHAPEMRFQGLRDD